MKREWDPGQGWRPRSSEAPEVEEVSAVRTAEPESPDFEAAVAQGRAEDEVQTPVGEGVPIVLILSLALGVLAIFVLLYLWSSRR